MKSKIRDLVCQIDKLEKALKNFKNAREQSYVEYRDMWELQEKQAALLLELAKQYNQEGDNESS